MELSKEEKEALQIIKSYVPHKGFFDLSKKPNNISNIEYAKILKTQNYLAEENRKMQNKKIRNDNRKHFDELRELSAKLQSIVLSYWDIAVLN